MKLRSPWIFFGLLLCLLAFSPKERAANQISRFNLVRAIVLDGTFAVDRFRHNTMDLAEAGGHYYSNKGPGTALLGVPIYAINAAWQRALGFDPLRDWHYWNFWFVELFSTNLPAAWLAYLIVRLLLLWEPKRPERAWLTGYAYAIGSSAFPFSLTMWGHQTAAAFVFAGFYGLERARLAKAGAWSVAGAAFCFGFAVTCEASLALLAPLFAAHAFLALHKRKEWRRFAAMFFAGGALPALGLAFYQWQVFGSPFTIANDRLISDLPRDSAHYPLFGQLGFPSPLIFWKLWFGLERGLFLFAPVMLLAPLGWPGLRRLHPWLPFLSALPLLLFTFAFSGFIGWHGGGSSGPRYLLPSLPFWALGLAFAPWGRLTYALLVLSVLNACAITGVTVLAAGEQFVLWDGIYVHLTDAYYFYDFAVGVLGMIALYYVGTRVNWRSWARVS